MNDVKSLVDGYAKRGFMTQAQYDSLMEQIQQDGQVDDDESLQVSRIFKLVQEGTLKIVDSEQEAQALQPKAEPSQPKDKKAPRNPTTRSAPSEVKEEILFKNRARGFSGSTGSLASSAMGIRAGGSTYSSEQVETIESTVGHEPVEFKPIVVEEVEAEKSEGDSYSVPEEMSLPSDTEPRPSFGEKDAAGSSVGEQDEGRRLSQASKSGEVQLPEEQYSIATFLKRSMHRPSGNILPFEIHSDRILAINLNGDTWIQTGSMIGYQGNVGFVREKILENGIGKAVSKMVSGEGAKLTKAKGKGRLYCADSGKKITLLYLRGETIVVNGHDLLAFQKGIKWEITVMKRLAAMMAGGVFNVRLTGMGMVAITSHYDPLTLAVRPGKPINTDPRATVAWSGNLSPKFKADIQLKTLVGRGSGESLQMEFEGEGFVVVQPFEEESRDADK
jgi:uncharacterized protein (AIM24 family)